MNKLFAFIFLLALATTVYAVCDNKDLKHCTLCAVTTKCTECENGFTIKDDKCVGGYQIAFAVISLITMLLY